MLGIAGKTPYPPSTVVFLNLVEMAGGRTSLAAWPLEHFDIDKDVMLPVPVVEDNLNSQP